MDFSPPLATKQDCTRMGSAQHSLSPSKWGRVRCSQQEDSPASAGLSAPLEQSAWCTLKSSPPIRAELLGSSLSPLLHLFFGNCNLGFFLTFSVLQAQESRNSPAKEKVAALQGQWSRIPKILLPSPAPLSYPCHKHSDPVKNCPRQAEPLFPDSAWLGHVQSLVSSTARASMRLLAQTGGQKVPALVFSISDTFRSIIITCLWSA